MWRKVMMRTRKKYRTKHPLDHNSRSITYKGHSVHYIKQVRDTCTCSETCLIWTPYKEGVCIQNCLCCIPAPDSVCQNSWVYNITTEPKCTLELKYTMHTFSYSRLGNGSHVLCYMYMYSTCRCGCVRLVCMYVCGEYHHHYWSWVSITGGNTV